MNTLFGPLPRRLHLALTVFLAVFATAGLHAQDQITVYGTVFDHFSRKKLDGASVTVYKNGGKLSEAKSNASGKYEMFLDYSSEYKIIYAAPGYVGKTIIINANNIPEEDRVGGHGMDCEVNLIPELKGVDYAALQQPFGKAKYDAATNTITWDMDHLASMKDAQARIIADYERIKKQMANAEEDFKKRMAEGEAAMTAAEYNKAVEKFTAALELKPNEPKATARLSDAKMKLDDLEGERKVNEQYAALIKEADALFAKKDYVNAKTKYDAALGVKEEEVYPKQKSKECETLIAELKKKEEEERKAKELEEKYKAALGAADLAFKGAKYEEAKGKYTEASGLKPAEQYPKDQIAACAAKIEELAKKAEEERKQKELDAKYTAAITAADASFKAGSYEVAKGKYQEALTLKAEEKYPKDQIGVCDKKIEELAKLAEEEKKQKELDAKYQASIAAADAAFRADRFDDAKAKYNEAIGFKPGEKYPKDQLTAIDLRIAELAKKAEEERAQKELNDKYNAAIAAADKAFAGKDWEGARTGYNDASGLKPAEKYPKDQLTAIDKAIADAKKQEDEAKRLAEIQTRYQKLIETADQMFGSENYEGARTKYTEASSVKPDESYPKDQVKEIDRRLADLKAREEDERRTQELEKRYNDLITAADKAYDQKKYPESINGYKDALALKPDQPHPRERIAEIEKLLDDEARAKAEKERTERDAKEKEQRYSDLMARADADFSAKRYAEARSSYVDAGAIKPEERKPQQRVEEIDRILAELAEQAEKDRLKAEEEAAERARLEAERLRAMQDKEAIEAQYRELISAADLAFNGKSYDVAREKYTGALGVKPDERYPKDRLQQIEDLLAQMRRAQDSLALAAEDEQRRMEEQRAIDERYRAMIAEADSTMSAEAYLDARTLYTLALDVKPQETWPQAQIERIDKILAEEERRKREAELAAQKKEEPKQERPERRIDRSQEQQAEDFMREAREREEADKYERIKKLKSDVQQKTVTDEQAAAERRGTNVEEKQRHHEQSAGLYAGSEEGRMANQDAVQAQKDALAAAEQQRRERAQNVRMGAYGEKLRAEEEFRGTTGTWTERQRGAVEQHEQFAEGVQRAEEDRIDAATDRREGAQEENARTAEAIVTMRERGDRMADENAGRSVDDKEALQRRQASLNNSAADRRQEAKEELDRTPVNQPRDFADYNRSKLAQQYPPGVTEESYTEGNKVIIKRIVVEGNKADEYSKVIAKWGTFYFKNGQSITEQIWLAATVE